MMSPLCIAAHAPSLPTHDGCSKKGVRFDLPSVPVALKGGAAFDGIHQAAVLGDLKAISAFLSEGVSVEAPCRACGDGTPLHLASLVGCLDVVNFLLARGANENAKDRKGGTPMHWAAQEGHDIVVTRLMAEGAAVDAKRHSHWTPLHEACAGGHVRAATALLRAGANIESKDLKGATPLHQAAGLSRMAIVRLLISCGADVSAPTNSGRTALHVAAQEGSCDVAEILIRHGASLDSMDGEGMRPLHEASATGSRDIALMLIKAGCDVSATCHRGVSPLHWASQECHSDVVTLLIEQGAPSRRPSPPRRSPFLDAVGLTRGRAVGISRGRVKPAGASLDVGDEEGWGALHWAVAIEGNLEVVGALIDAGARVNAACQSGGTALHVAAVMNRLDAAEALIQAGADLHAQCCKGATPLHWAAEYGHAAMAILLVRAGAGPNALSPVGTPLYAAAASSETDDVIDALILAGGDPALAVKMARAAKAPRIAQRVYDSVLRLGKAVDAVDDNADAGDATRAVLSAGSSLLALGSTEGGAEEMDA